MVVGCIGRRRGGSRPSAGRGQNGVVRAVIFDFFGTLTDPAVEAERREAFAATAAALELPADVFGAAMAESFPERITGAHGGTQTTLLAIARRCGVEPSREQLATAVAVHHDGAVRVRRPREGVFEVLDTLRARGFRLALLSDCSSELCERWQQTPFARWFDAVVFSWQEGYRKPDGRLYATAVDRLGVPAADCWYVGDGGSREHQGASLAGMRPVLVTNARFPHAAAYRDDPDPVRPDYVVDDVTELPALLRHPAR
jgi:putative hydrolase of the HAD superfamily